MYMYVIWYQGLQEHAVCTSAGMMFVVKFDSLLVECIKSKALLICLKFGLCKMFSNNQHHKGCYFCPIRKLAFYGEYEEINPKYLYILWFYHIFNKDFMVDFSVYTAF